MCIEYREYNKTLNERLPFRDSKKNLFKDWRTPKWDLFNFFKRTDDLVNP